MDSYDFLQLYNISQQFVFLLVARIAVILQKTVVIFVKKFEGKEAKNTSRIFIICTNIPDDGVTAEM